MIREPNNRVVTLATFLRKDQSTVIFLHGFFFFFFGPYHFIFPTKPPSLTFFSKMCCYNRFLLEATWKCHPYFFFFALTVGYETLLLEIANRSTFQTENAVVRASKRCSGGFSLVKNLWGHFSWISYPRFFLPSFLVVVVQSLSRVWLFVTLWTTAHRLPWLSPSPGACSNSCPLSQWCRPTISSSVVPFSSCLQSFPASGSFPMSQFFASGGQSIGVSASTSVLPMNTQDWFPLGWTGWISLQSKGLSRVFSNITVQKHQFFSTQLSLWSNSHIHTWLLEKP